MKKVVFAIGIIAAGLSLNACNKDSVDDGQASTDQEIQEEQLTQEELSQENDNEAEVTEGDSVDSDTTNTSVTEDAYVSVNEPIDFDMSTYNDVVGEIVENETLRKDMQDYLSDFYYNYYFFQSLDETGNVNGDNMVLFALSYIMQYENEELPFDADTYRLTIPVDQVQNVLHKYFYRELEQYKDYEAFNVIYTDHNYSVVVEDDRWDTHMAMPVIERIGDFTYLVSADILDDTEDKVLHRVVAVVDESPTGLHLMNFKIEEAVESADASESEE